jgi:predicted site-specific integrase-resolvase
LSHTKVTFSPKRPYLKILEDFSKFRVVFSVKNVTKLHSLFNPLRTGEKMKDVKQIIQLVTKKIYSKRLQKNEKIKSLGIDHSKGTILLRRHLF